MENQMEENVIFKLVIDDETGESMTYVNKKHMDTNPHFTVAPKMEMCTKEEFEEFIKNYPNELHEDSFMDAYSYNDFSLADFWPDTIVAMVFPAWDKDDEDEFKIAKNMDEVFASMKEGK